MIVVQNVGAFRVSRPAGDTTEFNDFAQIARTLVYNVLRYREGQDLSFYRNDKHFYGSRLIEKNKSNNLTVFDGTVRNVYETKTGLSFEATDPFVNYLNFTAETVDYSSAKIVSEAIKGNNHLLLDRSNIPVFSKIRFSADGYEYVIRESAGNSIEFEPSLAYSYPAGTQVTILSAVTTTAAESIKRVFLLAGFDSNKIGASFRAYHEKDLSDDILLTQNVSRGDNMTLREYLSILLDAGAFRIYTRSGILEISRIGEAFHSCNAALSPANYFNAKRYKSFDKMYYGYNLPYLTADKNIAFTDGYVDDGIVALYDNTGLFSIGSDNVKDLKVVYSSQKAADFIGRKVLDFYEKPKNIIECNIKYIDTVTKKPIVLYVGDAVNVVMYNKKSVWVCRSLYRDEKTFEIRAVLES